MDSAALVDESGGVRDVLDVISDNLQLILLLFVVKGNNSWESFDLVDLFGAEEVADLDHCSVLVEHEFHWEVGVGSFHGVLESLGDSDEHVLDVGGDGLGDGVQLAAWEPDCEGDLLTNLCQLNWGVAEVAGDFAAWTFDGDVGARNDDGDACGDLGMLNILESHCNKRNGVGQNRYPYK